jgi:penicillin G amidase
VNTELNKRLRLLASVLSVLVLTGILAAGWFYYRIRASLPQLDGRAAIHGLSADVTVDRDALGVPTIHGQTRADVARALGFLHAQDRYFQMDVWRRAAAGELSAVFGAKTLPHDIAMRRHGFHEIALATLAKLPADQRALVDAYTEGVNAGLAALKEKPFEYIVVRAAPIPWHPEDTLLVGDAMLCDLQDDTGQYERTLMAVRDAFGAAGLAFFAPLLTPDDAALDGSKADVGPIPGPNVINLRAEKTAVILPAGSARKTPPSLVGLATPGRSNAHNGPALAAAFAPQVFDFFSHEPGANPGSNAFALSGAHTATGAAMLASDIHLTLRVPNTWYRASFEYAGHKVTGITLPGVPVMIAGSNGHVAWSFTNAYVDTGDLVTIDRNAVSPALYRAPGHADLLPFEKRQERILVHGAAEVTQEYEGSIWGPTVAQDDKGRPLAYLWTGHDPSALNLGLLGMEEAKNVSEAIAVAHQTGLPAQNIVIADEAGDIAWTVVGRLPKRVGYDGRLPVSFQYGDRNWAGFLSPEETPVVTTKPTGHGFEIPSPDGRLWSANQRMIGGKALQALGDGGYARPNRAAQIRDDLAKLEHATPRDMLAIQLDDHAVFLSPWQKLLLATLTPDAIAAKSTRGKLRQYAEKWEGRASLDALSYPITRMFRIAVISRIYPPIFALCEQTNPGIEWNQLLLEAATWKLLREKPTHLLAPQYPSWDALLVAAADDVILELDRAGIRLPYGAWGQRNAAEIRHPFSYTLPWFVRPWLDMPADPLPGDVDMPRVQTPTHGASERFVVSPGHENEGIFHMPCGQSGHPLSPYYRAGHDAWVKGEPTPFLPGKTEHTLVLTPAAK